MSDKPKFSLLNHMREKQNVQPAKPTQEAEPKASIKPVFRPAGTAEIPRFKPAAAATTDVAEVSTNDTSVQHESKVDRSELSAGVPAAVLSPSVPTHGLTHQLEAMKLRAEAGKKALEELYITENQPFNELLERLDSLFDESLQLDDFNVQPARDIVEKIMVQLKEDPNLDGMMIDKDVGNIIAFVRKVKGVALDAAVQKKEKAEKTASNKNKKSVARFDSDALEGLNFSVPVKKAPMSLTDVSNIDLDKLKF